MSIATTFVAIAVLAFAAGVIGSFLIVRKLSGGAAVGAFLVWLVVPFVVTFVSFALSVDPTLSQERASYNVAMATVLTSFVIAIPWLVANLIGGLLGRRKRPAAEVPPGESQHP